MSEDPAHVLLKQVVGLRIRILKSEGEEGADDSWQKLTCHVHRDDLPHVAFGLIFAIGLFSFSDGRPRGASDIEFRQEDDWTVADMLEHLRYERGVLDFDADYVRGRMMKTRATVHPNGRLVIDTTNRHEMATRWVRLLQGKKHLRLSTVDPNLLERRRERVNPLKRGVGRALRLDPMECPGRADHGGSAGEQRNGTERI